MSILSSMFQTSTLVIIIFFFTLLFINDFSSAAGLPSTLNFSNCYHHFYKSQPPLPRRENCTSTSCVDMCHEGYFATLQNLNLRAPEYSAYFITYDHAWQALANDFPRPSWKYSSAIGEDQQYPISNVLWSGLSGDYDKGHLTPKESLDYAKDAVDSTFDMTNVVPQLDSCNQRTWVQLEKDIRYWIRGKNQSLHVVIAIGYRDYAQPNWTAGVVVPDYMIMALCDPNASSSVAFVGEANKEKCGLKADGEERLYDYQSISQVEINYLNGTRIFHDDCRPCELNNSHWFGYFSSRYKDGNSTPELCATDPPSTTVTSTTTSTLTSTTSSTSTSITSTSSSSTAASAMTTSLSETSASSPTSSTSVTAPPPTTTSTTNNTTDAPSSITSTAASTSTSPTTMQPSSSSTSTTTTTSTTTSSTTTPSSEPTTTSPTTSTAASTSTTTQTNEMTNTSTSSLTSTSATSLTSSTTSTTQSPDNNDDNNNNSPENNDEEERNKEKRNTILIAVLVPVGAIVLIISSLVYFKRRRDRKIDERVRAFQFENMGGPSQNQNHVDLDAFYEAHQNQNNDVVALRQNPSITTTNVNSNYGRRDEDLVRNYFGDL